MARQNKTTESASGIRNAQANALLDAMPLTAQLWNEDCQVFDCNEAAVRLFQFKDKQEYVERFFEVCPEYQPDGQRSLDKGLFLVKKAFAEGRCEFDWMHQLLDGTPIPSKVTLVRLRLGNTNAVAGYIQDLREPQKMIADLERRGELLKTVNNVATTLLTTTVDGGEFDASLVKSLESIGRCTDADRVLIWKNEMIDGKLHFVRKHKWLSEIGRQKTAVPVDLCFSYSDFPDLQHRLSHGECINGPLSELTERDQNVLSSYDVCSIVMIPLFLRDQWWGFFSLENCRHKRILTDDEVNIVRSAGLIAMSCLQRNELTQNLLDTTVQFKEATESQESFVANVLASISEGVFIIDQAYTVLKTNSTFDTMYSEHLPLVGKKCYVTSCIDYVCNNCPAVTMFETGKTAAAVHYEQPTETKPGVWLEHSAYPIFNTSGEAIAAICVVRDITKQKEDEVKLEAALEDARMANQAKRDFLARMSHEMRTPLNAVIGLSDLTLEDGSLCDGSRANIEKVYNAGSTLLSTVNDILDISKIEAGKFELVPHEYDVPSLINDTIAQCILRIGEKPIQFVLDIDERLPTRLRGDELRIKQIFNNLLSNAFNYTTEGTVEFRVRCVRESGATWLVGQVRDTGVGIRSEDLSRLFGDYEQMESAAAYRIGGTGLGLAISKRLAELMDGSIQVESEYGKGSTFTVQIRQAVVTDDVIGPKVVESLKNFRFSNSKREQNARFVRIQLPYARVLVVDDIVTNLDVARGLLRPYKIQVHCVTGGQQAVSIIREKKIKFNAIFMDHMMFGMDGIEATRQIRNLGTEYAENIPIIAMTANAVVGNEEMFLKNGFQAFLPKPIEIVRLDSIVRQWIRDKEQEQEQPERRAKANRRTRQDRRSGFDRRKVQQKIAGINLNKGIKRFGNLQSFLLVLRSFATNTRPILETIRNVTQDNLSDYAIAVHGIKGVCRGIYANTAGDMAEALEIAANEQDFDKVLKGNSIFIELAEKLIGDIESTLQNFDRENPKPRKDKLAPEALAELLNACADYDMDGVDAVMASIETFGYDADDGLAVWLRENVDRMNFEQIKNKLSTIINN